MLNFFHKYTLKIILSILSAIIFISCVQKHKFDNHSRQLSDNKMAAVISDILLMESYVGEKMFSSNTDSLTLLKKSFYPLILNHHKVDSSDFYATFSYFQAHPKEFSELLALVDSNLSKTKPLDTTIIRQIVEPPKNIDELNSFNEQEEAMQNEFMKQNQNLQKFKRKNKDKSE